MTDDPTEPGTRGFALTAGLLLVVLAATAGAQLPAGATPAWLRAQRDPYRAVWPQGWSYFVAPDGIPTTGAYRVDDAATLRSVLPPLTSTDNLGGVGRRQYAIAAQIHDAEHRIPAANWRACGTPSVDDCVDAVRAADTVTLDSGRAWPALCGPFVLTHERTRPTGRTVIDAARVDLSCPP